MNTKLISFRTICIALGFAFVIGLAFLMPVMKAHAQMGSDGSADSGCGCDTSSSGSGSGYGGGGGSSYNPPTYSCPAGTIGTYPNCQTYNPQCPAGTTGVYPNCHVPNPVCPTGTTGTYPNCVVPNPVCPAGTTGTYPNCQIPTPNCPAGSTGTYPNCQYPNPVCPSGTSGVYPNCVIPTTAAPITINNTNTNTNNNPNTNTLTNYAPVTTTTGGGYQYPTYPIVYSNNQPSYVNTYTGYNNGYNYGYNYNTQPTSYQYGNYNNYNTGYNGYNYNNYVAPVTYNYPRYQPATYASAVTLTQIPYTGFDGDLAYWASIVALALSAALLLMYYQGGTYVMMNGFIGKIAQKIDAVRGVHLA